MNDDNTPYFRHDADIASAATAGRGVWLHPKSTSSLSLRSWLYWAAQWLFGCYDKNYDFGAIEPQIDWGGMDMTLRQGPCRNRNWRRWRAFYYRCGSKLADEYNVLLNLQPRGLSPTQKLERISHVSHLGRVRLFALTRPVHAPRRRMALACYDSGFWHAPLLRACPEPLRPP